MITLSVITLSRLHCSLKISWIHQSWLKMNPWIRMRCLFVRICVVYSIKDLWKFISWGFLRFVKTDFRICVKESNWIFKNLGFVDHYTNWTFLKLWIFNTNLLEVRICVHVWYKYKGTWFPQPRWVFIYTLTFTPIFKDPILALTKKHNISLFKSKVTYWEVITQPFLLKRGGACCTLKAEHSMMNPL